MWEQMPFSMSFIKIVCCRAVFHFPCSCLLLMGRQYAWQGEIKCHGTPLTGKVSTRWDILLSPLRAGHSPPSRSLSPPLFSRFLFSSSFLVNPINVCRSFLSRDTCCKYCDKQSNKVLSQTLDPLALVVSVAVISNRGDVVCLNRRTVRAINT